MLLEKGRIWKENSKVKHFRTRFLWMVCVLIIVMGAVACEEEALEPEPETEPGSYTDLTQPDHVVQNMLQCYKDRNVERYLELLYDPDYLFCYQEKDVEPGGEECLTLLFDYDVTRRIFLAAKGTPEGSDPALDGLDLFLADGSWAPVDSIGGEPCNGCMFTKRLYTISVTIGETIYMFSDDIALGIKPVDDNGVTRYKILRAIDLEH